MAKLPAMHEQCRAVRTPERQLTLTSQGQPCCFRHPGRGHPAKTHHRSIPIVNPCNLSALQPCLVVLRAARTAAVQQGVPFSKSCCSSNSQSQGTYRQHQCITGNNGLAFEYIVGSAMHGKTCACHGLPRPPSPPCPATWAACSVGISHPSPDYTLVNKGPRPHNGHAQNQIILYFTFLLWTTPSHRLNIESALRAVSTVRK